MSKLIYTNNLNPDEIISLVKYAKDSKMTFQEFLEDLQERRVIGHVSDYNTPVESLAQAETEGGKFGLHPLSTPELVTAVATIPAFYAAIRNGHFTSTSTGEVLGTIDDVPVIQDQHGVGVFATSKGITQARVKGYLVHSLLSAPLIREGEGIPIVGYEDLREGNVPGLTGYVTQLENLMLVTTDMSVEEVESIRKERPVAYISGSELSEERTHQDDLTLSRLGGPQGVDLFCKILYGSKSEGGEGHRTVKTRNEINTKEIPESGAGLPVFWERNSGLDGGTNHYSGRYASGK